WGGLTSWSSGGPVSHGRAVAISLAGPAAGIVAGGLCAALLRTGVASESGRAHRILNDFVWASAYWGALNRLPLQPRHGANAFGSSWAMVSPKSATRAVLVASAATGLVAGTLALYAHWTIPGVFALWLGFDSARRLRDAWREAHDAPLLERLSPVVS